MKFKDLSKISRLFSASIASEMTTENTKIPPVADGHELCVMCGVKTDILVSMSIESRENYVAGCGQLCSACYKKICK